MEAILPVIDSLGEVLGGGGRIFTLGTNPSGKPFITFGDGVFGRKLLPGETVIAKYRSGGGSLGNVPEGTVFSPVDINPLITNIINPAKFSGGTDAQTIAQLQELIPASLRTLNRAVSESDYSDILIANFPQVFTAATEVNTTNPGVDLNIYVVPQGTGIPQITDNPLLQVQLSNFLDRRKMVTVQYQILNAFGIDILLTVDIYIVNTASKSAVQTSVLTAIQNYFNLNTGGPTGSGMTFAQEILLKDLTNVIETVNGIDHFEIKRLTYRPRVQENVVNLTASYQFTEVSIYPNIETVEWLLAANSVTATHSSTPGDVFSNSGSTAFTYTSGTGVILYSSTVDLSLVSPGDLFRDGAAAEFTILGVNNTAGTITIATGQTVNTTPGPNAGGSVRYGTYTYNSFLVFKKILGAATNLSSNSITDVNLDFTIASGTGTSLNTTTLLDSTNIYIPSSLVSYLLVDSGGNVWSIAANTSNTIKVNTPAINNAGLSTVAAGNYLIVENLINKQIAFQNQISTIQCNTNNTIIVVGAEFNQIGTIGNPFVISTQQTNVGNFGIAVNITGFTPLTKTVAITNVSNPGATQGLEGFNGKSVLIDSIGQVFNITSLDNSAHTVVIEGSGTPVTGLGASITYRYYDDNNELSFASGYSSGVITFAADANLYGKGTVDAIPDSNIDNFVFRTSDYSDDITNLRAMEIPTILSSDIVLNVYGGVS